MTLPEALTWLSSLAILLAFWLAFAHPEYSERPLFGLIVCWLRGHGPVVRAPSTGIGYCCETCGKRGDFEAFALIDDVNVEKKEEKV